MKLGFSMVSHSLLSSFLSFQTLQLVIHSSGVTGLQSLHSLSRVLSMSVTAPWFLSARSGVVRVSCVFMCFPLCGDVCLDGYGEMGDRCKSV